jgi:hypothetical protein
VLISAVVLGWLLGGPVAWLSRNKRLKREIHETRRQLKEARAEPQPPTDGRPEDA